MQPQPALNLLPTVQEAIDSLLTVYEPEFLRFGYQLFLAVATIVIAWQGIRMMFSHDGLGEQMFDFAKLLLFVSFGYAFIAFYQAPIPGIGVSFSNLITDQAHYFLRVLEARAELLQDLLEQLLVDSKRARDSEATILNMQIILWRDGQAANDAFVAGTGDALQTWRQR